MSEEFDSAVIVALVAPNDNPSPPEGQHITICFMAEQEAGGPALDAIATAVAWMAAATPQFDVEVKSFGSLGPEGAKVLFLDEGVLTNLRTNFLAIPEIMSEMQEVPQYLNYTPHMTIGYGEDVAPASLLPIRVIGLGLWNGEDRTDFMFSTPEPAVTVASIGEWDPSLHPRGKDGKFITKFGIVKFISKLTGQWEYGKVVGIGKHPGSKTLVDISVQPSDLSGNPNGKKAVNLPPSSIYAAPKPKATIKTKDMNKIGGQAGSNSGGLYEVPPDTTKSENVDPDEFTPLSMSEAKTTIKPGDRVDLGTEIFSDNGNTVDLDAGTVVSVDYPKISVIMDDGTTVTEDYWHWQISSKPAPETGKFYVKQAKSALHGKNEALANALYEEAGVAVPEVQFDEAEGNIYSKIVVGVHDMPSQLDNPEWVRKVQNDFAVDSWLSNWDVFGMTYDNILTEASSGQPYRIDNGGALLFRAMGEKKDPSKFGSTVGELESMRIGKKSKVYGTNMPLEAELDGATRVLAVSPDRIEELVAEHGLPRSLADTLKARRQYIADYYKIPLPETMQPSGSDYVTTAPLVDPLDAVEGGNLPRTWSKKWGNLFGLYGAIEEGDQVRTPSNVYTVGLSDSKLISADVHLSQIMSTDPGPYQIKKPVLGGRPGHGAMIPTTSSGAMQLASLEWHRGDQIVIGGTAFDVLGVNRQTYSLVVSSLEGNESSTFNLLNLPGTEVQTLRWDPPALSDHKPVPSVKTGMAVSLEEKIKSDLEPAVKQTSDVSMVLGDGTIANPGDTLKSKVDGSTWEFIKKKGPFAVVYGEDKTKTYQKLASTLLQPGKEAVEVENPKSKNGIVPEIGMVATAKDGKSGEIYMISPDGKYVFFKYEGKKTKKTLAQVDLEADPSTAQLVQPGEEYEEPVQGLPGVQYGTWDHINDPAIIEYVPLEKFTLGKSLIYTTHADGSVHIEKWANQPVSSLLKADYGYAYYSYGGLGTSEEASVPFKVKNLPDISSDESFKLILNGKVYYAPGNATITPYGVSAFSVDEGESVYLSLDAEGLVSASPTHWIPEAAQAAMYDIPKSKKSVTTASDVSGEFWPISTLMGSGKLSPGTYVTYTGKDKYQVKEVSNDAVILDVGNGESILLYTHSMVQLSVLSKAETKHVGLLTSPDGKKLAGKCSIWDVADLGENWHGTIKINGGGVQDYLGTIHAGHQTYVLIGSSEHPVVLDSSDLEGVAQSEVEVDLDLYDGPSSALETFKDEISFKVTYPSTPVSSDPIDPAVAIEKLGEFGVHNPSAVYADKETGEYYTFFGDSTMKFEGGKWNNSGEVPSNLIKVLPADPLIIEVPLSPGETAWINVHDLAKRNLKLYVVDGETLAGKGIDGPFYLVLDQGSGSYIPPVTYPVAKGKSPVLLFDPATQATFGLPPSVEPDGTATDSVVWEGSTLNFHTDEIAVGVTNSYGSSVGYFSKPSGGSSGGSWTWHNIDGSDGSKLVPFSEGENVTDAQVQYILDGKYSLLKPGTVIYKGPKYAYPENSSVFHVGKEYTAGPDTSVYSTSSGSYYVKEPNTWEWSLVTVESGKTSATVNSASLFQILAKDAVHVHGPEEAGNISKPFYGYTPVSGDVIYLNQMTEEMFVEHQTGAWFTVTKDTGEAKQIWPSPALENYIKSGDTVVYGSPAAGGTSPSAVVEKPKWSINYPVVVNPTSVIKLSSGEILPAHATQTLSDWTQVYGPIPPGTSVYYDGSYKYLYVVPAVGAPIQVNAYSANYYTPDISIDPSDYPALDLSTVYMPNPGVVASPDGALFPKFVPSSDFSSVEPGDYVGIGDGPAVVIKVESISKYIVPSEAWKLEKLEGSPYSYYKYIDNVGPVDITAIPFYLAKADGSKISEAAATPTPAPAPATLIPGVTKPDPAAIASWGGNLTKDGFIPAAGMAVKGKGPMYGKILSVSKDKTKATVITSAGGKTTRLISALSSDVQSNYISHLGPVKKAEIPEGGVLPTPGPKEAFKNAFAKLGSMWAIANGHKGIRSGETWATAAEAPSGKKYVRVGFTMTKEQRAALKSMLETMQLAGVPNQDDQEVKKGAWTGKSVPSADVEVGQNLSMRHGVSLGKWKVDNSGTEPTHVVVDVTPYGSNTAVVALKDLMTGVEVVSVFHTDEDLMMKTWEWDPGATPPPKVEPSYGSLSISDGAKAAGWELVNDGVMSGITGGMGGKIQVEPGKPVPLNLSAWNESNIAMQNSVRLKLADGTVVEVTNLAAVDNSHAGVVMISIPEGGDTSSAYGNAMAQLGMDYEPVSQDSVKSAVRPLLKMMVNGNKSDIDTSGGWSDEDLFSEIGGIVGIPDIGWNDVQVSIEPSVGKVTYLWSERVRSALSEKAKANFIIRAASTANADAIVSTIKGGTANAVTKRLTGMVVPSTGKGLGASPSSDAANNAGHGGFMSAFHFLPGTHFPTSNKQAQYKESSMMVYQRMDSVLGRIADIRSAVSSDNFGAGSGTNLKAMLSSKVKDFWVGGGVPPEGIAMIAVISAAERKAAIDRLHAEGITHLNGIPIEEIIVLQQDIGDISIDSLAPYIPPVDTVSFAELPVNAASLSIAV